MTVTLTLASLLLISVLACLVGFGFGFIAATHAAASKAARMEQAIKAARPLVAYPPPPLPRPGLFPVDDDYPVLSENPAGWDRLERNVVQQTSPLRAVD